MLLKTFPRNQIKEENTRTIEIRVLLMYSTVIIQNRIGRDISS